MPRSGRHPQQDRRADAILGPSFFSREPVRGGRYDRGERLGGMWQAESCN